jgi:tRNA-specific 2-thiouridylase
LGEEKDLYTTRVEVRDINFSAFDRFDTSLRCKGKLRYRQKEEECIIHPVDENTVIAEFEKPQRAVTPGQAAVFYDGDIVLGGGTIV